MISIKIEKNSESNNLDFPDDIIVENIVRSGYRISLAKGKLYGFYHIWDDLIVIGESIVPVAEEAIYKAAGKIINSDKNQADYLPDDVHGMFIFEPSKNRLCAANSISTCRPYFYSLNKSEFAATTSIKMLPVLGCNIEFNEGCTDEFFSYRIIIPESSIVKDVSRLLGGETVKFDLESGKVILRTFWEYPDVNESDDITPKKILSDVDDILKDHTSRVFEYYQNPDVLLSGGTDSSLLAAIAVDKDKKVTSTSSGFNFLNKEDVEEKYATSMAQQIGINHTAYSTTASRYLKGLVEAVYHAEEPINHLQSVLLYLIFKEHYDGKRDVSINGQLADSLFGDSTQFMVNRHWTKLKLLRYTGLHAIYKILADIFRPSHYLLEFLARDFGHNYASRRHILYALGRYSNPGVIGEYLDFSFEKATKNIRRTISAYSDKSLLDLIMVINVFCQAGVTMPIWSRLAEGAGVALDYPFAVPKLIKYSASLPWNKKLIEGKYYIKALLREKGVSDSLIYRKKSGFGFPIKYWALPGALLQPVVDLMGDMYDPSMLHKLQKEDTDRAMLLWNLINLFIWRKLFIEQVGVKDLTDEILRRQNKYVEAKG